MRRLSVLGVIPAMVWMAAFSFPAPFFGQNPEFNLNVHTSSQVTAKDIGLPDYPGATPFQENGSDSSSGEFLLRLNSIHFSVKAASFVTTDSPERVLQFYRRPLEKFGEVLECDHGKPVGSSTATRTGLTCGDPNNGKVTVNGNDSDHQLRAGTPEQLRIVAVSGAGNGRTKFGLVELVLPKDPEKK